MFLQTTDKAFKTIIGNSKFTSMEIRYQEYNLYLLSFIDKYNAKIMVLTQVYSD